MKFNQIGFTDLEKRRVQIKENCASLMPDVHSLPLEIRVQQRRFEVKNKKTLTNRVEPSPTRLNVTS
jgi:hypothetical protein